MKRTTDLLAAIGISAGVLAVFAMICANGAQARGGVDQPIDKANTSNEPWGPIASGFRCRLVAVPSDTNDETPDLSKTTNSFPRGDDVAFAVELKNVSDKPATLLGVRYGDSYPTAKGKLATEWFAPHLFEFEFSGQDGRPLARPTRAYLESMMELSGASAHAIEPGKSLVVLLRPARFSSPMGYQLPPGSYQAKVRYRGPAADVLAKIKKHWPDKPQSNAWSGEVTSNPVAFTIADDPQTSKPAELNWGEAHEGLRAAVEFRRRPDDRSAAEPAGAIPLNSALEVVIHLKNVSEQSIAFVSETWRQEDQVTVKNETGEEQKLHGTWYSGWPVMVRWLLRPGEVAEISSANLGVAADDEAAKKFEHPVGKTLIAKPGIHLVRYDLRLGSIQSKDKDGNITFPAKTDWQGNLATGETRLEVRLRTPEDDARERAGHFVGRIEFVANDGQPIRSGSFTPRASGRRDDSAEVAIHAGPIEIPDCSSKPFTIAVRAPGYEEAWFSDVLLTPNVTKRLELLPTAPTSFRVLSQIDGKPIAGAKIRLFNKTSDGAASGPIPMDDIHGQVWAASETDGTVRLDTLQKTDPYYAKLGDAVYVFYIEAPGFAGHFLGGVKAGHDLGEIKLGLPVDVRGEIHGTPEELHRFAAEWDQPVEMRTATPAATWIYAVSQSLETKKEKHKLTFHLTGLRPGKLRIISNFGPHPHSVAHTYGRRDPKGTDVVVEVDLVATPSDLIITPTGQAMTKGARE